MPSVVFYQLPPSPHWPAVAQLVALLMSQGKMSVIVATEDEVRDLSRALWALPPSLFAPHGVEGDDADEELDPVVIAIGSPTSVRPVVVQASIGPTEALCTGEVIAEVVPGDERLRGASRDRYKAYKERGWKPRFVAWQAWSRSP